MKCLLLWLFIKDGVDFWKKSRCTFITCQVYEECLAQPAPYCELQSWLIAGRMGGTHMICTRACKMCPCFYVSRETFRVLLLWATSTCYCMVLHWMIKSATYTFWDAMLIQAELNTISKAKALHTIQAYNQSKLWVLVISLWTPLQWIRHNCHMSDHACYDLAKLYEVLYYVWRLLEEVWVLTMLHPS